MHNVGKNIAYRRTYDLPKLLMKSRYNAIVNGTMVNEMKWSVSRANCIKLFRSLVLGFLEHVRQFSIFLRSGSWCYWWRGKNSHVCGAARTLAFAVVGKYRFFQTAVRGSWVMLLTGGTAVFSAHKDVSDAVKLNQFCPSEASALWSRSCLFPSCSFSS